MPTNPFDRIPPFDKKTKQWRVVIETPKGSRNKYKLDEDLGVFTLSGVLPEGMSFPYDFGFLPGTLGADGDPLDVLLLMDQAAFPGCVLDARLIGVIAAEQTERDGKSERNDRIIAVAGKSRVHGDCKSLKDVNPDRIKEIQEFFVSYNRIAGKKFKVLDVQGPGHAESLANDGIKSANKRRK